MNDIRRVLNECLDAAAAIQRHYFEEIEDHHVTSKGLSFDLQTIADTESEKAIVDRIQKTFPTHSILAEESGRYDQPGATVRWIIDPLDGTGNYRHGFPNCAISIAIEIDGAVAMASVYNPLREERYFAQSGQGATRNGKPIHVSPVPRLDESLIVAGFPYDRHERMDHYVGLFKNFMHRCHGVLRMGSAAMDLCYVASGQLEAYYEESLQPWDWAAGKFIVEQAGGLVTDYHNEDKVLERRQLLATNGLIHQEMLAVLTPAVT